jgi:hypothetical protein
MLSLDAGEDVKAWAIYRATIRTRRPLIRTVIGATAVVTLLMLTLFLVPVAIWLIVRWSLLAQTSQIEGASARDSLRRSSALVRGRWWRTALVVVGFSTAAFVLGPLIGALLLLGSDAAFAVVNIVAALVYVFTMPFVAILTTYVYFDLRVRQEVDLEQTSHRLPAEFNGPVGPANPPPPSNAASPGPAS